MISDTNDVIIRTMISSGDFMSFEDFCAQNNIVVTYYSFSTKVRGCCMKIDDYYLVAVNPRFSNDSMKRTLIHEIMHIMEDHLLCDQSEYEKCEEEINRIIISMKKVEFNQLTL